MLSFFLQSPVQASETMYIPSQEFPCQIGRAPCTYKGQATYHQNENFLGASTCATSQLFVWQHQEDQTWWNGGTYLPVIACVQCTHCSHLSLAQPKGAPPSHGNPFLCANSSTSITTSREFTLLCKELYHLMECLLFFCLASYTECLEIVYVCETLHKPPLTQSQR